MFRNLYTLLPNHSANRPSNQQTGVNLQEFLDIPRNETSLQFKHGSQAKKMLEIEFDKYYRQATAIVPIIVGSTEIRTEATKYQNMPFEHRRQVAIFNYATKEIVETAITTCLNVREAWEKESVKNRAEIFMKAADLAALTYRYELNAAITLGQGKTIKQAEKDTCQIIDFFRFNALFAMNASKQMTTTKTTDMEIIAKRRGLEGFVAIFTPFNFTSMSANMCASAVIMGNVVIWKPANSAILSNYLVFKILREAGVPSGVINFVPCSTNLFIDVVTNSPDLAGINFAGSVSLFRELWKTIGKNIELYRTIPELSSDCGGQNFHFVHSSADINSTVTYTLQAAFDYQGQKCSACSRLYVPKSLWSKMRRKLNELRSKLLVVGSPLDHKTTYGSVIDKNSFDRAVDYIERAKNSPKMLLITGGDYDMTKGYYVSPTIFECTDINDEMFSQVLEKHNSMANKQKELTAKNSKMS